MLLCIKSIITAPDRKEEKKQKSKNFSEEVNFFSKAF